MFESTNPFLRKTPSQSEDFKSASRIEDVRLYITVISLIMAISLTLSFLLYNYLNDVIRYIVYGITTIVSISSIIIATRVKGLTLSMAIIYAVFISISLAFISSYLNYGFNKWFNYDDGEIFITIAYTVIFSELLVAIFYVFFGKGIRNFWFTVLVIFLGTLLIGCIVIFTLYKTIVGFSFIKNLIAIIPVSFIIIYFMVYTQEEIRRRIQDQVPPKWYTLSFAFGYAAEILFIISDLFKMIFPKTSHK